MLEASHSRVAQGTSASFFQTRGVGGDRDVVEIERAQKGDDARRDLCGATAHAAGEPYATNAPRAAMSPCIIVFHASKSRRSFK